MTCQQLSVIPETLEWLKMIVVFCVMAACVGSAEVLKAKFALSAEWPRKFVHISIGVIIFFFPKIFTSAVPPLLLGIFFIGANGIALRMEMLKGMHGTVRRTYGTVLYPVSFVVLILLFWNRFPEIISLSMLVLALGDAGAAIVGESVRSPHIYRLSQDKKSFEGTSAMFVITFAVVWCGLVVMRDDCSWYSAACIAVIAALMATAWEALPSRGSDNLTVPLSTACVLYCYLDPQLRAHASQWTAGVLLALFIAGASYRAKFLSVSGSVATFILASIIYGVGGWKWTIPILTFFILSSMLSKVGRRRKKQFDSVFEKTSVRDYAQVAANGGVGGIVAVAQILFPSYNFYPLYLGSIAAVTADTWGTELGLLFRANTYSLPAFSLVEQGANGGVSLFGFMGACLGSIIVSLTAIGWLHDFRTVSLIALAGITGGIVDSLLGGTVQVAFQCVTCSKITEKRIHCGSPTFYAKGIPWIDNDTVNWLCALTGCCAALIAL